MTIAVLDTGVAYEDFVDADGTTYVAAASLRTNAIVAPWDFVADDPHANDDHQHGTHIASVIASEGDLDGVAPGAALMPLKVLDANNTGSEYDLIEALYYAADQGADVVNLSLAFGPGYVPSGGLLNAIDTVVDAGIVVVAASGNEGASEVSWPAASPRVIAVGAYCPSRRNSYGTAPYSNTGPALDVLAPGGCLDRDVWGAKGSPDGSPDGIVGETFETGRPASPGYWLMAGTSQATAVVTGAIAHLIASGADPAHAALYLQDSSVQWQGYKGFEVGLGAGRLQVDAAMTSAARGLVVGSRADQRYDVSLTPYLTDNGDGTVTPTARVTVIDVDGQRATKGEVVAQLHGASRGIVTCDLHVASPGTCLLQGPPVPRADAQGALAPLAWRFVVSAVLVNNDYAYRPSGLLFASDTFDALVGSIQANPDVADATLAFHWSAGPVDGIGEMDESYVVMDSGAGISTSPFGLILTPESLAPISTMSTALIDGAGISTSPFGVTVILVDGALTGSGISTSPFGMIALDAEDILGGAGISTSPFGMTAITDPDLDTCMDACTTFWNDPIRMATSEILAPDDVDVSDSALLARILDGGWTTPDGTSAASTLSTQESLRLQADSGGASLGHDCTPQELVVGKGRCEPTGAVPRRRAEAQGRGAGPRRRAEAQGP